MPTRTAGQRRLEAKAQFDAFFAECPTRQFLDVLTDKWTCLVVNALATGPRRHSDLARQIAGVSQKMLTQTLRSLERDGIVTRTVTPSVPVRVDYELTELGADLRGLMVGIKAWAEANMTDVLEARQRYDEQRAS